MRSSRARFLLLFLTAASACRRPAGIAGRVLSMERLGQHAGVELLDPRAAIVAGTDTTFVLDAGAPAVLVFAAGRLIGRIGTSGAGPGQFRAPSALLWYDPETMAVVDPGNARIALFDRTGAPTGTVPFPYGPGEVIPGPGETLVGTLYARKFALNRSGPVIEQKGLVSVINQVTGVVEREFGTPRPYTGEVIPLFGNAVNVAYDRGTKRIWVAWPLEPVVQVYGESGEPGETILRPIAFTPPPPKEYHSGNSPLPAGDFQRLTFGISTDAAGQVYVLTAASPKTAQLGSKAYRTPRQALQVFSADAKTLRCEINLPVTGVAMTLERPGSLLLVDALDSLDVFRLKYACPES